MQEQTIGYDYFNNRCVYNLLLMNNLVLKILLIFAIFGYQNISIAAEPYQIAVVKSKNISSYEEILKGAREELNIQGISFTFEEFPKQATLTEDILSSNPDLILTLGSDALSRIPDDIHIPVVFSGLLSPPESLINKHHISGSLLDIPPELLFAKLQATLPEAKTIGVIYHPETTEKKVAQAHVAAEKLGLQLKTFPIQSAKEIPKLKEMGIDALWIVPDPMVCRPAIIKRLLLKSYRQRIPVMGISSSYVKAGALLALVCDYEDIGRQSGEVAAKILSGLPPSKTEITIPRSTKLYLNKSIARRLGIKIPKNIIAEASEVFGK